MPFQIVLSWSDYLMADVTFIPNVLIMDVSEVPVEVTFVIKGLWRVTYLTGIHDPTPTFVLDPWFADTVHLPTFVAAPLSLSIFYGCPLLADLKYYIYVIPWPYLRLWHINGRRINTLSRFYLANRSQNWKCWNILSFFHNMGFIKILTKILKFRIC